MGDDTLTAYCAGFLDGEGYVATVGKTSCVVKIDCVNPTPLFIFQSRFGGSVTTHSREGKRRYFRWAVHGTNARKAVAEMIPYLHTKKVEAEAVLQSKRHPADTTVGIMLRKKAFDARWEEY